MATKTGNAPDPEIQAIAEVFSTLKGLDADSQTRVIDYVRRKLGLSVEIRGSAEDDIKPLMRGPDPVALAPVTSAAGVSPMADKWLRRSGLSMPQIERVFNIGAQDEIDVVANKLLGKTKAARSREVILLKAAANYLSTGVPKVNHEVVKQTCEHYDAYDVTNFSKTIKSMAPELSGSKQSGYTLTARGLAAAADLIKQMSGVGGSPS